MGVTRLSPTQRQKVFQACAFVLWCRLGPFQNALDYRGVIDDNGDVPESTKDSQLDRFKLR